MSSCATRARTRLRVVLVSAVSALALLSGCADAPDVRIQTAWDAAEAEDFEAFLLHFTESSRDLLRGMAETKERTRGDLAYIGKVYEVLPKGEVMETKIRGNLALVTIKAKRRRGEVRMLKERGEWVVDATTLPELWHPLRTAGRDD